MSTIEAPARELAKSRARGEGPGVLGFIVLTAVGLATLVAALALHMDKVSEWAVLLALAALAMVGVFALFGAGVGLIRFGEAPARMDVLQLYADELGDGLQVVDSAGRVLYANAALGTLLGLPGGMLAGGLEQAFASEPHASEAFFRLTRAASRREAAEEVFPLAKRGIWLRLSVQPLAVEPGKRGGWTVWRVTDVTGERARNERALRQLEDSLHYLDSVPLGFLTSTLDGRIDHINATLVQWLGLEPARASRGGYRLSDLLPGEASALLGAAAPEDGQAGFVKLDIDLLRADGTRLPARVIHQPVVGAAEPEARARTLVLNRSAGEALDEDARAAEVRFSRFLHSAPFGIATLDREGRMVSANGLFARMFAGPKQGKPRSIRKIIDRVDDDEAGRAVAESLAAAVSGGTGLSPVEVSFGGEPAQTRRLYFGHIAQSDEDAGKEAAILYAVDTTEQKALEIKFAQSQKMEAVGQLAGGVAHDFNNVLTAIIGFSDLLLTSQRPTDAAYSDIVKIKQQAEKAAGIVGHLLAFSRKQTLKPDVISLAGVISDFTAMMSRYIGERVKLKLAHGRDLWLVKADRTQLEQVLMNLAVNARDAMPGGGTLSVRTRNVGERESLKLAALGMEPGEYVLCEVEDTGVGMTAEVMDKIFMPFFTTKEVGKGTGLGLSTVYGIVKQTGGYIFPHSTPGKGTVFRIYLPRHVQEAEEQAAEAATAIRKDKEKDRPRDLTGTGCVLLVEDEDAVRNFAMRALKLKGYEVLTASTGAEALEIMEECGERVDVIVSDVVMPEMDGPTLLKCLRERNMMVRFIFASGYPDDNFRKSIADGEEIDFLPKPFDLPQLASKVKEVMSK